MRGRRHWPDCYVNHGPIDATCDMGPECGTVTPETLTDELVESLFECAHPNGEGPDPNHKPDQILMRDIATWKRCSVERRRDHPAAYRICYAINARTTP